MAEVSVTAYKIADCRFFDEATGEEFGDAAAVMENLLQWIGKLATVGESCTYEPKPDDPFLRAYCFDARRIPGEQAYLLAMWNESDSKDDSIQLLSVDSAIGEADVSNVDIDPQASPGYPAYFVVMPERGLILNLRFEHRLNGSQPFRRYILGFMQESSDFCVWDEDDDTKLLGYCEDMAKWDADSAFLPLFRYQLVRRGGDTDWLRRQVTNIRKVIRRAIIYPKLPEHRPMYESAYGILGLTPNNRQSAGINFEYDFKVRLTPEKLEQIIAECAPGEVDDAWSDVGFVMAKQASKIHWLSGSYAREKSVLDVARTEGGMVDPESLANILGAGHLQRLLNEAL